MELYKENKLKIYNSLSKSKEEFKPLLEGKVGMYVCGPTVYSNVHLGNLRTFMSFDMVYRYLLHLGYKVRYVRNITDAGHLEDDGDSGEDKITKKARLEQIEPMEVVQKYVVDFHSVTDKYNFLPPSIEPTATGHIVEQIEMIKEIIEKGFAYEVNGSVYFDVLKYNESNNYGILSGRTIEDAINNTRELDGQSDKKNPQDFALWKKADERHIMRWPSPWSDGFPGWHLECSVMSSKYLGEQFDIHGGGMDLKFPHHECEIAQSHTCSGVQPVNYWMHANMLLLNGQKMSKSTGNFVLPNDILTGNNDVLPKEFGVGVVRFFAMQAHYRSVLDFSGEALLASEKGYKKLMEAIDLLDEVEAGSESTFNVKEWIKKIEEKKEIKELKGLLLEVCRYIVSLKDSNIILNEDIKLLKTKLENIKNKLSPNDILCCLVGDSISILKENVVESTSSFDVKEWRGKCYEAMNDDFNTPILISHLFDAVKFINQLKDDKATISKDDLSLLKSTINAFVFDVLGLVNDGKSGDSDKLDGVIELLIKLRKQARDNKDWAMSDQIRDELLEQGIQLKDGREGTTYSVK